MTRIWLAPAAYFPNRGGIEELTHQLASTLKARGHDVNVIVNRWPDDAPQREVNDGITVERLDFAAPSRGLPGVKHFAASVPVNLRRLRSLPRPEVIHVQGGASQLAHLFAFATLSRVPLVVTTQGEVVMDAGQIYQRSVYQRRSLAATARGAAALTACSQWTKEQTTPVAPAFAGATVVPNAVYLDDWAHMPALTDQPVLAAWGRHVPQKGFGQLLQAFALLHRDFPEARLLLGGSGTETATLKQAAPEGVEFLGGLDRRGVKEMLGRARVAVVPSVMEPFGIVALEVLAAKRTLVHSGVGGLPEAAGPHGLTADVHDAEAFAATLKEALNREPEDASAWLTQHSWTAVTDSYEAIYRDVLASRA